MLKMIVSEAFLIAIDDILSLYLLASPYSSTGIQQLLQTCIYRLSERLPGYRSVMRNVSETVIRTIARACPEESIS
jgi:hypothetical protein